VNWKIIRVIDAYMGIPLVYALLFIKKIFRRSPCHAVDRTSKRILLVKFWGIGNIFMMLPSLKILRNRYPSAEMDILTLETSRRAAENTETFGNVYAVDTRGYGRFISSTLSILSTLRAKDYDVVIDFEQFARFSALCIALTGKKVTVGFNTAAQHRHVLYSHPVIYDNRTHVTRSYCALVKAVVADSSICSISDAMIEVMETFKSPAGVFDKLGISADGVVVMLHVGTSSNFRERRWPTAYYAALADLLIGNHGAQIVLTGLEDESFLSSGVIDQIRSRGRVVDASGTLSFDEYLALIRSSDLVVSADTAAVHIASAAGIPVVGLYGPNTPVLYGPWGENGIAFYKGLDCSPCITNFNAKTHDCRHSEGKGVCMKKIDPEEVYQEIRRRYFDPTSAKRLKKLAGTEACIR
jgi:ADP-heptose:LPS heptosyltransferase